MTQPLPPAGPGLIPQPVPYELAQMRARVEAASAAEAAALALAAEREENRLSAVMRAERADASAAAAHNELLEVTKK